MSAPWESIPRELADALAAVVREEAFDVYTVRETEGEGWEGPRVKRMGEAIEIVQKYAAPIQPDPAVACGDTVYFPRKMAVGDVLADRVSCARGKGHDGRHGGAVGGLSFQWGKDGIHVEVE